MPKRKPTDEEKERLRRGIRARNEALKALMEKHGGEFERLHAERRVAAGLPAKAQGPTADQRKEQIRRWKEKIRKWEEEIGE